MTDYSRDQLGASEPMVLIGNSLGGTNAFCFAARHPHRVRALVIEEGPPKEGDPFTFVLDWRDLYPTKEALEEKIGGRLIGISGEASIARLMESCRNRGGWFVVTHHYRCEPCPSSTTPPTSTRACAWPRRAT
ncbi:MAG: alpha/beta fold hydrolase [Rubrivivax sp.]|nr:MAG: alpha/beta fold hydrolase [Rubrivivax sp.]